MLNSKFFGSKNSRFFVFLPLVLLIMLITVRISSAGDQAPIGHSFAYLSPAHGARYVPAESTIAFRLAGGADPSLISNISFQVSGAISGEHEGRVILGGDEETIIFRPDQPFALTEEVLVIIRTLAEPNSQVVESRFTFEIAPPLPEMAIDWPDSEPDFSREPIGPTTPAADLSTFTTGRYVTGPANFPIFQVAAADSGLGDGYIFLGYYDVDRQSNIAYAIIMDDRGQPVYYHYLEGAPAINDFKVQLNGQLSFYNANEQKLQYELWDETYQLVNTYDSGNGYLLDLHDIIILENDHALLLAKEFRVVDMSQLVQGGRPNALVRGCVIQEVDAESNVLWQWLSLDHIPITDTTVDMTRPRINYMHCNSLEVDDDDNLLLSSRHLDEVTKIDRQTGEIIWRLGGKASDFTFVDDPHGGFFHQHDARRLANGNITVYDNRTEIDPAYFSRGVEYSLDMDSMEATMAWQYINTPTITYAGAMGSTRRLPGGNTLIGWGRSWTPMMTEVSPAGEKLFELSTAYPGVTYRAFRFPWHGYPTWPPALVARSEGPLKIKLYFSWNGATEIASYRLYGDSDPLPTTLLADVPRDGFESTFLLEAPGPGVYYFRVMPVDLQGQETEFSPTVVMVASEDPLYFPIMLGD